jgi:NTP pyrophosphatase (non-canonical NTP hydrolase)
MAEAHETSGMSELAEVIERLRAEGGCPWCSEQTHESLVQYLLEETYELIEAIEAGDRDDVVEELGDVLYQVMFHASLAAGNKNENYTLDEIAQRAADKMIGRHPHVFGDVQYETADDVIAVWEELKKADKPGRESTLDGVPPLPDEPGARGASAAPSGGSDIKRLSHEESLSAEGRITHLIINPARTACFDGNGDGTSDGVAIVFEPRDADERLVTAGGDVSIVAYDPATPGGPEGAPLAKWDVPSAEALAHFRRTSRARGLHFTLPWQGRPPAGDHVRIYVKLTSFDGQSFETDATVPVR